MSVVADRFSYFAVENTLAIVPGVVLKFPRNESRITANEPSYPVLWFGVHEIAVQLSESEVAWLERNSTRSRLKFGNVSEISEDSVGVNVFFFSDNGGALVVGGDRSDDTSLLCDTDRAAVGRISWTTNNGVGPQNIADIGLGAAKSLSGALLRDDSLRMSFGGKSEDNCTSCDNFGGVGVATAAEFWGIKRRFPLPPTKKSA